MTPVLSLRILLRHVKNHNYVAAREVCAELPRDLTEPGFAPPPGQEDCLVLAEYAKPDAWVPYIETVRRRYPFTYVVQLIDDEGTTVKLSDVTESRSAAEEWLKHLRKLGGTLLAAPHKMLEILRSEGAIAP